MMDQDRWKKAEEKILECLRGLIMQGSLGVQQYMDKVHPLRERMNNGERSEELLRLIEQLKMDN
jgi:pyrroloquinoline quinone (PQQ) biosynthesis protein C